MEGSKTIQYWPVSTPPYSQSLCSKSTKDITQPACLGPVHFGQKHIALTFTSQRTKKQTWQQLTIYNILYILYIFSLELCLSLWPPSPAMLPTPCAPARPATRVWWSIRRLWTLKGTLIKHSNGASSWGTFTEISHGFGTLSSWNDPAFYGTGT